MSLLGSIVSGINFKSHNILLISERNIAKIKGNKGMIKKHPKKNFREYQWEQMNDSQGFQKRTSGNINGNKQMIQAGAKMDFWEY